MPSRRDSRRRVLIVVSAFKPAMIADMQRARMLAWELPKMGWDVEVLSPGAAEVRPDIVEDNASEFFPPDVPIHTVGSFAKPLWNLSGSRTHAWRTLLPMYLKGRRLLQTGRFDLVFFSTTTFVYFAFGPRWRRSFNVPYVTDFHDPWVKDGGAELKSKRWRSRLAQRVTNLLERSTVVNAAGLVAVSPSYIEALRQRYKAHKPAWLDADRHAVVPFGALESDLATAAKTAQTATRSTSGEIAVHYVGAGGLIMRQSFALICSALASLRAQGNPLIERLRIRLFGTTYDWKVGDPKHMESIAQRAGLGGLVEEIPARVPYRRSLELLLEGDGALILGVDDSGYMPSKLFAYALSGKPLLASLRRDSPAFALFQEAPDLGHVIWFDPHEEMFIADAAHVVNEFLQEAASRRIDDRSVVLKPFLASAMAQRHVELFNACLDS
jgi:glycosyl transferase family 4